MTMKDYRVKEIISKNKSRFYVQFSNWLGWSNFNQRMDGDFHVFDTLVKAQDCIKGIRDTKVTDVKYHYLP